MTPVTAGSAAWLAQVLPTQLIPDEKEGKVLRVRFIQKEGVQFFNPAYLFDGAAGLLLHCSAVGSHASPINDCMHTSLAMQLLRRCQQQFIKLSIPSLYLLTWPWLRTTLADVYVPIVDAIQMGSHKGPPRNERLMWA